MCTGSNEGGKMNLRLFYLRCFGTVAFIALVMTLGGACTVEEDIETLRKRARDKLPYTVTFNINGGTGTAPGPREAKIRSGITLPGGAGLKKTGYTFDGWNTKADGTGTPYDAGASYTVTGDATLYAQWYPETETCTVAFNRNGGSGTVIPSRTVKAGDSIILPGQGDISRPRHTFGGWNTKADGTGTRYGVGDSYPVTRDSVFYAQWNINTYTVSFDANGGSGAAPSAQAANAGSRITLPNQSGLSKTGYTFGGWNTKADNTGTQYGIGASYPVSGNSTLYAFWNNRTETCTVTFNANGGTGTAPSGQTVIAGSTITLPGGGSLSRNGYIFGGWNTSAYGTGTNSNPGDSYTPARDNIILYAKWDLTYTVSFDANGGSGTAPSAQTVPAGSVIVLPGRGELTKGEDTFGGWNANAAGTGANYGEGALYPVNGDGRLYANWIRKTDNPVYYTVTFNANGGSGMAPAAQTVLAGSTITLPNGDGLEKDGSEFGGWNTNASGTGTNSNPGDSLTVTGTITLYAKWDLTCTVTFNANGATSGTAPAAITVKAGSVIILPGPGGLSKTECTFGGWNTNAAGTGANYSEGALYTVTDSITLYARWLNDGRVYCTVTFETNGGSPVGNAIVPKDTPVGQPSPPPTRTGYTFAAWFDKKLNTVYNFASVVTIDIWLRAEWTPNIYTVIYDRNADDAAGTMENSSHTYDVDKPLNNAKDFTRTGYTFAGWARTAGGAAEYADEARVINLTAVAEGAVTLYAKWNPITYIVTYNSNGGTGTMPNSSHTYDVDKNLTSNAFTRTGHTFAGWARTPSGDVEFANGASVKNLTATAGAAVPLYAKWNPIAYTVTFNANSGTPAPGTQNVDYGGKVTEPTSVTRSGYTLEGWYTGAAFTNKWNFANDTVTGNVTLYAKWTFTVTYNLNNGTGTTPATQTVTAEAGVTLAASDGITRASYAFAGWNTKADGTGTNYNAGSAQTLTGGNVTLYAKWEPITDVPGTTLAAKLQWLQDYALSNVDYTVTVNANESIGPNTLSCNGKTNVSVTLIGVGANRIVDLSSNGAMFTVSSGVTLVLDNNITLRGRSSNTASLVAVNSGGTLVMNGTSRITGNITSSSGGGVHVASTGNFTMSGSAEISGNTTTGGGGGVEVRNNGAFTMNGGTISGNTATSSGGGVSVYGANATFTMTGGTIGGTTSGNTAKNNGGGVNVFNSGTFRIVNGTVYGSSASPTTNQNTANNQGAALYNSGTAQYYKDGKTWTNITSGNTYNNTINVTTNGVLQ